MRAAHSVVSDYSWSSSVSTILNHLGWLILAERHLFADYQYFTKLLLPSFCSKNAIVLSHHQPSHMPVPLTYYTL